MMEPVRLIIWDLDETFWRGTLTEGGISYVQAHHDLVIDLAKRGIMSSICSKNDFEPIRKLLTETGLWDYFIFPSINWEAKGPRLAALVEAVSLRPETILFIDDNPLNRSEANHYVPKLLVASEEIVPYLGANPLLKGKDDSALSRLAQYKLLESRFEAKSAAADNTAFLRASNIRVTIERDLTKHRDRVIELINRTNQLNFTKRRISEDPTHAEAEWTKLCNSFDIHGGLVHVADNYGDYGFVGVYFIKSYQGVDRLLHFCFSCRTLGMGVEKWLFERLGRPRLQVAGEVLTDLFDETLAVDWINAAPSETQEKAERLTGRIFMRGGCHMSSAAHYLAMSADEVVGEFNICRDNLSLRLDHSLLLTQALEPPAPAAIEAACRLGYAREDFTTALADKTAPFDVCIFCFITDSKMAVYTHPETGIRLPFHEVAYPLFTNVMDMKRPFKPHVSQLIGQLREEGYRYERPSAGLFKENLEKILSHIPPETIVIFLLGAETDKPVDGVAKPFLMLRPVNEILRAAAARRKKTYALNLDDFALDPEDRIDTVHFGRMVYFRLYQHICALLKQPPEIEKRAGALHWPAATPAPAQWMPPPHQPAVAETVYFIP